MEGELEKSPPLSSLEASSLKHWRVRWFVLDDSNLRYFRSKAKSDERGCIPVSLITDVKRYPASVKHPSRKYIFSVVTDKREYYLVGKSEEDVQQWIGKINEIRTKGRDTTEPEEHAAASHIDEDESHPVDAMEEELPETTTTDATLEVQEDIADESRGVKDHVKADEHSSEPNNPPPDDDKPHGEIESMGTSENTDDGKTSAEETKADSVAESTQVTKGHGWSADDEKTTTDLDPFSVTSPEVADGIVEKVWQDIAQQVGEAAKPIVGEGRKTWQVARIFVSSTFADMFAEREVLVREVFPRLRTWCDEHRIRLIECDLRWGVPKESTSEDVFRTCLGELDRCRQDNGNIFFINLLGSRYGWLPTSSQVPASVADEYLWVPNVSITHMEILHGAYRDHNPNAAFFIRDSSLDEQIPDEFKGQFIDTGLLHRTGLATLKTKLRENFQDQVFDYKCDTDGVDDSTGMRKLKLAGLDKFGEQVYDFLLQAIQNQYPLSDEEVSRCEELAAPHLDLQMHLTKSIVGLEDEIAEIIKFVESDAEEVTPLVLVADPGFGKSTVMAQAAKSCLNKGMRSILHFTSTGSGTDEVMLLVRLCLELGNDEECNEIEEKGFEEVLAIWEKITKRIEDDEGSTEKIVIFIDGCQSLAKPNAGASLGWVPATSTNNKIRYVLSTGPGHCAEYLQNRQETEAKTVEINPLTREDRKKLVESLLGFYNKRLDDEQTNLLIENDGSKVPLWLTIACEELRVFGVFETITNRIQELSASLTGLLEQVLRRVNEEDRTGKLKEVFLLLAASRNGLSETELAEILGEEGVPLARAVRALLFLRVKPFVKPVGGASVGQFSCYNDQVVDVITTYYGEGLDRKKVLLPYYKMLADYFEKCPNRRRKNDEYPYCLMEIEDKPRLLALIRSDDGAALPYSAKQRCIKILRCPAVLFGNQKVQGERMCTQCSMKRGFSTRFQNKQACCICGNTIFSMNMQPGKAPVTNMGETQACRCRKHNQKAHFPAPPNPATSFVDCFVCKRPSGYSMTYPVLCCRQCSFGAIKYCTQLSA